MISKRMYAATPSTGVMPPRPMQPQPMMQPPVQQMRQHPPIMQGPGIMPLMRPRSFGQVGRF